MTLSSGLGAAGAWLWVNYHTHWVDPSTIIVAVLYAFLQRFRSSGGKPILSRQTGWDMLNGLALFPLFLLMGSSFSKYLTAELVETNKVIMFGAGALALFAVLEDPGSAKPAVPPKP